ncbi:hypothetical protein [Sporomusa carbonis]|uniref:hypothetical protein n=1 Tax=Sporomusa carbonis TaxID=3076075 RepID=UPI003C7BBC9E
MTENHWFVPYICRLRLDDLNTAEPLKLKNFGQANEVSYVLLVTLHPLDISADIKLFDVGKDAIISLAKK